MGRALHKLSAKFVENTKEIGRHGDGGGLYLSVSANGGRRWVFMYRQAGKLREMGLGSARDISLAKARDKAQAARSIIADGGDPIAAKEEAARPVEAKPAFGTFADAFVATLCKDFSNAKHRQQWANSLKTYAAPLYPKQLDAITIADVHGVLQPIWGSKAETASRVRGRIERVLDAAKALGHIASPWENPARWLHLKPLFEKRNTLTRGHHAALPYDQMSAFMASLKARTALASLALQFTILTAARTGEALGARWSEIDFEKRIWTVPAERMKARKAHRVPLSDRAIAILKEAAKLKPGDDEGEAFVFPGQKEGRPLSNMSMEMILRRMKAGDITVHGFRSTFRDWAAETTPFPHHVCEMALAHTVGSKVERAYRRTDLFDKRRLLMDAWAAFCDLPASATILPMRRKRTAAQAALAPPAPTSDDTA